MQHLEDPPQPPLKRGENPIKVPLFKGDLGGSPGLKTRPRGDLICSINKGNWYNVLSQNIW